MLPFRPARASAVALLAVLLGALLPAGTAQAADRTVQGGRLDWGIKSSFQRYVTGPIAHGSWRLTSGAATVGGSQFRFHSATGTYDPATGSFTSRFSGGVHFLGHRKADGSHELDLALSRPTVRISGGQGTLFADMVSRARSTGRVTTSSQVPFASLNLSGISMKGGAGPIELRTVPATLTSQGATAFADYYTAGTPLDPISLRVDLAPARTKPSARPSAPSTPPAAKAGALQDAAVDWGVRRTFREYVTGPVAQGRWTLTDGAQDGGALFRFPRGKGSYDAGRGTLSASFAGSVRFTGDGLDLRLSKVRATVSAGRGTLTADVARGGETLAAVPLVTFAAPRLVPKKGLAAVSEAPASLTAQGAAAFGGMYAAGTVMDPVSLAVTVDRAARLPALPDLGSEAAPSPRQTTTAPATASRPAAAAASSDTSSPTGTYLAVGAGALAAAAIALYAVRRRRTAQH
ncbi:HtaA domain-containing protein [Streptomyces sp. NBC_01167]|uniref:HtaA domain-containing protein n=1 Tax=Streptomyces sp. NBC_01167 TaxID=2903756 RepID=UPI0038705C34|nr:HtaA domain-containing protein [Streptomyces sp. NBC_01167]